MEIFIVVLLILVALLLIAVCVLLLRKPKIDSPTLLPPSQPSNIQGVLPPEIKETEYCPTVYNHRDMFLRNLIVASSTSDISEAAKGIIQLLLLEKELKIHYVSLYLWLPQRHMMDCVGSNVPIKFQQAFHKYVNTVHLEIIKRNLAAYVNDSRTVLTYPTAKERGVCFEYYIPLYRGNELIGAIMVESVDKTCQSLLDYQFFQLVIDNISLVMYTMSLIQRVMQQSNIDNLTKLYNRTYMQTYMTNLEQMQSGYGLIILDIDFFKKCNDIYGHAVGDLVLQQVSRVLLLSARDDYDGVFRYGGEEFIIVLRGATLELTRERAELVRKRVEELVIKYAQNKELKVTISLGVMHSRDSLGYTEIIKCADKALYYSKEHGRNQVTCFVDIDTELQEGKNYDASDSRFAVRSTM